MSRAPRGVPGPSRARIELIGAGRIPKRMVRARFLTGRQKMAPPCLVIVIGPPPLNVPTAEPGTGRAHSREFRGP
jgi:hypothetical protein